MPQTPNGMIPSLENYSLVPPNTSTWTPSMIPITMYDYLDHDTEDQYLQYSLNEYLINWIIYGNCQHFLLNSPTVVKLTIATELAITTEKTKPKVTLPLEYINYTQVFSKEITDHVFLSYPYDHKIKLDDSFVSKIGTTYSLSPYKKKVTEDFLATRMIHMSFQFPPSICYT